MLEEKNNLLDEYNKTDNKMEIEYKLKESKNKNEHLKNVLNDLENKNYNTINNINNLKRENYEIIFRIKNLEQNLKNFCL